MGKFTKKNAKKMGRRGHAARYGQEAQAATDDLPEGPPLPVSSAERRKLLDVAHWWAATHSLRTKPPDELHRMMQEMRRSRDPAFFRQVMMPVTNQEAAAAEADLDEADYRKILDDVLAEMKGRPGSTCLPGGVELEAQGHLA